MSPKMSLSAESPLRSAPIYGTSTRAQRASSPPVGQSVAQPDHSQAEGQAQETVRSILRQRERLEAAEQGGAAAGEQGGEA